MRIYVDGSALIKRVIDQPESDALDEALERHVAADDVLVASSLAWVEVTTRLIAERGRTAANLVPLLLASGDLPRP